MTAEIFLTYLITFVVGFTVEHLVIYLFISRCVSSAGRLYRSVFIVNLITFPLTQVLAYWLVYWLYSVWRVYYFAEVIPFGAEYFLLKWQFGKLKKSGALRSPVSNRIVFVAMVVANIVTFAGGIIYFE